MIYYYIFSVTFVTTITVCHHPSPSPACSSSPSLLITTSSSPPLCKLMPTPAQTGVTMCHHQHQQHLPLASVPRQQQTLQPTRKPKTTIATERRRRRKKSNKAGQGSKVSTLLPFSSLLITFYIQENICYSSSH
jgi:hypothetical protein